MARPQVEDGHTKIANELVKALSRAHLSAYESRVLWCILGKTYGWNKKSDRISYSQFEEFTGMKHWHIGRTLKLLSMRNIIVISGEGQNLEYGVQKDYEKWVELQQKAIYLKPVPKEVLPDSRSTSTSIGTSETDKTSTSNSTNQYLKSHEPVPKEVLKPVPKEVHTKAIKHYTKAIYKSNSDILLEGLSPGIWEAFLEMRKRIKAPVTEYGKHLILKELERFKSQGYSVDEILNQSIRNSWRGIFPPKEGNGQYKPNSRANPATYQDPNEFFGRAT